MQLELSDIVKILNRINALENKVSDLEICLAELNKEAPIKLVVYRLQS